MNNSGDPLDRLLKSAAQAPIPVSREAVFTVEARVMAGWRAALADESVLLVLWLRRTIGFACMLVLLGALWNVRSAFHHTNDETVFADSALQIALNQ